MNLLFITYPDTDNPFVTAFDLDHPEPEVRSWRADASGVRYGVARRVGLETSGHGGTWRYLAAGTWVRLTQHEAYARFPALQAAIETHMEPW